MTDERFWDIVDSVGWPVEDTDAAKVEILMNTAPAEIKEFRNELDERTSKLREFFDEAREDMDEDFYVSGDGLDDCVNHIVGCGEHEYRVHVLNPEQIVRTYRNGRFVENFSYAVPYATEYEKLGTEYYTHRSHRCIDKYDEIAKNEKFSEDYRRKATWMVDVLESFPYNSSAADRLEYADQIGEPTEEALLDWMHETEEELSDDINGWPVRNLVSDYRTYYIYNQ
jgi:hypothetical protein